MAERQPGWEPVNRWATALYAFEGNGKYEIPLCVGDRLKVLDREPRGWMQGININNGKQGNFPASYVELQEPLPAAPPPKLPPKKGPSETTASAPTSGAGRAMRARASSSSSDDEHSVSRNNPTTATTSATAKPPPPVFSTPASRISPAANTSTGSSPALVVNNSPSTRASDSSVDSSRQSGATPSSPVPSMSLAGRLDSLASLSEGANRRSIVLDTATPRKIAAKVLDGENIQREIAQCMKEWVEELKRCLQSQKLREFNLVKDRMAQLADWRMKLLDPTLPESVRAEWRRKIIRLMEGGRRLMGLDIIPRTPQGEPADENNTGLVKLVELYNETHQRDLDLMSESSNEPKPTLVSLRSRRGSMIDDKITHLVLNIKLLMVSIHEPTAYYISLFHKTETGMRQVTDNYVTFRNAQQVPCASLHENESLVDLVQNCKVIFSDIPWKLYPNLYLVVRLFRNGKLVDEGAGKPDPKEAAYRRPVGVSVLHVGSLTGKLENENEVEQTLPVMVPKEENQFGSMHEAIVQGKTFETPITAKGVALSLRMLNGELSRLREERRDLDGVPCAHMLELGDIRPGLDRHELYVIINRGDFLQGTKKSAKNVMITAKLVDVLGNPLGNHLSVGTTNVHREYHSVDTWVEYHNNEPVFNDTVVVRVPKELMGRAHLRFEAAHISSSKKPEPFSFSFIPLMDARGVAVPDGVHALDSFKIPAKPETGCPYLPPPPTDQSGTAAPEQMFACHPTYAQNKKKESLVIQTILCSTTITQNQKLNDLLHWRQNQHRLADVFEKFKFVEPPEMLKFLPHIFDAMFSIATTSQQSAAMAMSIFNALVTLLVTLGQERAQNLALTNQFRPLLAHYINTRQHSVNAPEFTAFSEIHEVLVGSLNVILSRPESTEMRNTMKCLRYILQLMIASRNAFSKSRQLTVQDNARFKEDTTKVLTAINKVMQATEQVWAGTQAITIKSFDKVFSDLSSMYSSEELGIIAQNFIQSIRPEPVSNQKLLLVLIKALVDGHALEDDNSTPEEHTTLFMQKELREIVTPTILQCILPHLEAKESADMPQLCVEIVLSMLKSYEALNVLDNANDSDNEVTEPPTDCRTHPAWAILQSTTLEDNVLAKLFDFLETCTDEEYAIKTGTAIVATLHALLPNNMDGPNTAELLKDKVLCRMDHANQLQFLSMLVKIARHLGTKCPFKDAWVVMHMTALRTSFKICNAVGNLSVIVTPTDESIETVNLVKNEIIVLLTTVTMAKTLKLSSFSQFKQEFVLNRYGDLRTKLCELASQLWDTMPIAHKHALSSQLFERALELARSADSAPSRDLAHILYADMVMAEFATTGRLEKAEQSTMDNVTAMMEDDGGKTLKSLLQSASAKISSADQQDLATSVGTFVRGVIDLVDHMTELQQLDPTPEHEIERSQAAVRLISYLNESHSKRQHLRFRTVMLLARDVHETLGNHVEVGLVLKAYADTLTNSSEIMPAYHSSGKSYNEQPMRERKELVLNNAFDFFNTGKDWERAISVAKELQQLHEADYRYEKLSYMLQQQAELYKKIMGTERFFPEYFRVEFRGSGFGDYFKDTFVFRGAVQEDLRSFMDRMQRKFPKALIKLKEEPQDKDKDVIFIATVRPAHWPDTPLDEAIPEKVRKYLIADNVNVFTFSAQERESKDKTDNEFKDMWTIRYFYFTEHQFPHPVRCSRVIRQEIVKLNPVQSALENLKNSHMHLTKCIAENEPKEDRCGDTGDLSRYLGGIIDAAVNGGPRKYVDAFMNAEYSAQFPDRHETIKELKMMLVKMSRAIPQGLAVHRRICTVEMLKLQEYLEGVFEQQWMGNLVAPILRELEANGEL